MSSSLKPIMIVITRTGSGIAKEETNSHFPSAAKSSINSSTNCVMRPRRFSAPAGVKKGSAMSRYFLWFGGLLPSMLMRGQPFFS